MSRRLTSYPGISTNTPAANARAPLPRQQANATLQSIDVSHNMLMDKSWQKLLNHVAKGKARS